MKIIYSILFIIAVVFCIVGLLGHTSGFVAGALCFFAATMVVVGKRNK